MRFHSVSSVAARDSVTYGISLGGAHYGYSHGWSPRAFFGDWLQGTPGKAPRVRDRDKLQGASPRLGSGAHLCQGPPVHVGTAHVDMPPVHDPEFGMQDAPGELPHGHVSNLGTWPKSPG